MAPTPQEYSQVKETVAADSPQDANNIVISGMSGLYPESRYVKDFEKILYDKVNPITTKGVRWQYNHPEAAQYGGSVPELDRFDAQFFKVHYRLGTSMDAMAKKILEQSYEAIYDAGVNPHDLSGKKVGVYIGTCFSESEKACFYVANSRTGFGIAGCSKTMFANRISYWLNAKGPSMSIDEACCSSTAALEQAYLALARGECEAAVVGGAYLCLHPQSSVHYSRVMTLSKDGKTKSFDQYANGCAKSEAVNVLFLQKAKDALRIYAYVKHVKSEFRKILEGKTGPRYGFYRDPADTALFLKEFYDDARIPPQMVEYVEAFGSAVPEADKSELEAIAKVFCESRSEPLLVGSVMSNIGYGEAASGISAITKVLLGYHKGMLAGNLHCETPRNDVAALREGRIKLLTDHHQFCGTYAAVNSMSVTGVNSHVLLHGLNKHKDRNRYISEIPRLVTISGRQESSVLKVLNHLKTNPVDPEELALLNNIHKNSVAGHLGRGYIVLDTNENKETVSLSEKACYFDNARRPLWFVYSGMGSQWVSMGTALMRIPVFAKAIERCHQALEPKGLNIVDIITSSDSTTFDNILHSFVGIAAIQIGLTDVLRALGLVPDGIIGHSVGELGCAYADGCLTAEEMILSAYSRGLVSLETKFIRGSMAAVGLGYEQISKICPPEIEVACHNSSESSTISGPEDVMRNFVTTLTAQGIFAKEVPCSNIAYHSRYIAGAGPGLLKYLKEIIKNPRERSERWVSTSVAKDKWNEPISKYSSAEYHTNNLLNPVLFEETSNLIPSNAVLVEVAPHGLLQAILKRSLPESCVNISLTRRGHPNNVILVLEAIGKLYMEGFNLDLQSFYPKVELPVSTGTPFLSHFVDWAHEEKWVLPLYSSASRKVAASRKYIISINDDDCSYLKGHVIQKKILLPSAFVLVAVWDTLAMVLGLPKNKFNVKFDDVRFYCQPVLHGQRQIRLNVALHRGNGRFEVLDDYSKVATGFIQSAVEFYDGFTNITTPSTPSSFSLSTQDVYKLFNERECNYSGEFKSICCINISATEGKIFWNDNWVTLIDGMLQLNALKHAHCGVSRPERIRSLIINVNTHQNNTEIMNDKNVLPARIYEIFDLTSCGGIVIKGVKFHNLPQLTENEVTLKTKRFVPRFQSNGDIFASLDVFYQIIAENINKDNLKVVHVVDGNNNSVIAKKMKNILSNYISGWRLEYNIVNKKNISQNHFNDVDAVIVQNLSNDDNMCKSLYNMLPTQTFLINEEDISDASARIRPSSMYSVVAVSNNKNANVRLELVRWRSISLSSVASSTVNVRSKSDLAVLVNARNSLMPQSCLFIVTSYPPPVDGLKELVKQWRRELIRNRIYLVMVNEGSTRRSDIELPNVNLAFNILDNGVWGGEYYTHVDEKHETEYNALLQSQQVGDIESLKWVESPDVITTGIKVKVHYAGINLDDVRKASGLKSADVISTATPSYGMDFSGITETGERVMGIVENGSTRSTLVANPELTWPVPSYWSLEDAATVPLAYVYVLYCFYIKAINLCFKKNYKFSVLIHGGAGALGQAAINVALASGYRVFTTVSDLQKKKFLLKLFPDLKEENIGCSRDISFSDMVLTSTGGKGVDVVFSCVKGELKDFSLKICAAFGITFDTDQLSSMEQYTFGLNNLTAERAYIAVDIRSVFSNPTAMKRIRQYMVEGISDGWVRPLSRVTFASVEATRAFQLVAASKHRGRVLLKLTDTLNVPSTCRLVCSPHHNHLIMGDSESLVLGLADRLVGRGAKNLHLHFSQTSAVLQYKMNLWQNFDVKVRTTTGEVTDDNVVEIIKQAKDGAFLAGVFITNTKTKPSLTTSLDIATRRLTPYLKHLLILEFGEIKRDIKLICFQRSKDGLPATYLKMDLEQEDCDATTHDRYIIESIEQSLGCQHPVVIPHLRPAMHKSLLQQIADLVGSDIDINSSNTTTLQELGLKQEKSQIVLTYLNDMYNVYVNESDVPSLNLQKLKEIENNSEEKEYNDTRDFDTFFTFVDPDELLATTEMVFLPTQSNNSDMREDEFDPNETYLWIVPGMEGHHDRFRTLCERLKLPALVLQPGLDYLQEDPHQLATRYYKVVMKKIDVTKKFYVLGFESGVSVALELAALLEKQGLTGTVYCVGDGPKEISEFIEEKLKKFSNDLDLQRGLIEHMFKLMVGGECEYSVVDREISGCSTWSQRVEVCVRILLGRVSHSAQYARSLIDAAYSRLLTARQHAFAPKLLQSQIVLLRALTAHAHSSRTSLQDYCSQPVIVYDLPTPLARITEDLRCAAIINRHLSKEIISAFNERSLCDSYLLNADVFMVSSASQ